MKWADKTIDRCFTGRTKQRAKNLRDDTIRECLDVALHWSQSEVQIGLIRNAFRQHYGDIIDATQQRS